MLRLLVLCGLMGWSTLLRGQATIGLPEITNYDKQTYRGGAQTRQVAQDKTGNLYFANDEGVLKFDGVRWKLYPLPNKSLVRCLRFGPDENLYVGGQDEVGYFAPSATGTLQYHSLKNRLPQAYRSFADVWELHFIGRDLFFQTSDRIYRLGAQTSVYPDPHWQFMGSMGATLVAQSAGKGLLLYQNGTWKPYIAGPAALPVDYVATSLTPLGRDSFLLTTLKQGVFLLAGGSATRWSILDAVASKNISTACLVNKEQIALGTMLDGCYIIDRRGSLIQHFGRAEGLQNNSILSIFLDVQQNLWLGLHNGIGFIPYNNAVTHLASGPLGEGAGFSSKVFDGQLYMGTSIGLYTLPLQKGKELSANQSIPLQVHNTTGDAWNLSEVGGQLFMGHNDGAFAISSTGARPLDRSTGYWNFQSFGKEGDSQVVAGTYKGIAFYRKRKDGLEKLPGEAVVESARFVVTAHNKVWFSHPYKGIFSVTPGSPPVHRQYGPKEGVTSVNNNYLFKIKNELVLTTDSGVLVYHPQQDRFLPSAFYNKHLPPFPIRYMKEDRQGNVWFVFEKKVAVLDLSGRQPQVIDFPELTNKFVAGFEHINPVDSNNILIGGEKGFYHINYARYKELKYPLPVLISGVYAINQKDSALFGGYGTSVLSGHITRASELRLDYLFNSLRFEFASPVYGQLPNIEYSYYLEGFDKTWSPFSRKREKDYTNLPPGNYVFRVKARNNLGRESPVQSFAFAVLPPWYKTAWAYLVYALVLGLALYQLYRYQQRKFRAQQQRHEEEQRRLQYLHQLEMDKAEKELIALRNAKLEAELQVKNTELASAALHLVQKSDVLQKIKAQMGKLKEGVPSAENAADLKKILKTLNEENKIEEQWQQFATHFDVVHRDFLSSLKKRYPTLTPNEQKLCAYLKMNLTTKEIAQLMNITPRGVEISRYRLRKKLEVPQGVHLFNFFEGVG
jgi:DNA-binding CsgD family transcriptional regulator